MRHPAEHPVRDHDVRPGRASPIDASTFRYVLAYAYGEHPLARLQAATQRPVAYIEEVTERRHGRSVTRSSVLSGGLEATIALGMMWRRLAPMGLILMSSVGAVVLGLTTARIPDPTLPSQLPDRISLFSALADHGWLFRPVDPKEVAVPIVSADAAKRTALHEYGVPDNDLTVYLGRLSPTRTEVIDPRTLAYAVQIRGLSLPRIGAPTLPGTEHHELVVFVDARTGDELLTTSFR